MRIIQVARSASLLLFSALISHAWGQSALHSPEPCGTHLHAPAVAAQPPLHKTAATDTLIIPTVVHVVYDGAQPPITVADVERYFHFMHEDFRNLPGSRAWGATPDFHLEFQLATLDPNGDPTTGVNFIQSADYAQIAVTFPDQTGPGPGAGDDNFEMKSLSRWDSTRYLNIWVVEQITQPGVGILAGFAQYPWTPWPATDGVVVKFNNFALPTYNFTTTHEIGHWMGLIHPFDSAGCQVGSCLTLGDKVCDTPSSAFTFKQDEFRYNHCVIEETQGAENPRNYMDYIAGQNERPNHFSHGQMLRARSYLQDPTLPRRRDLATAQNLASTGCGQWGRVRAYFWSSLQDVEAGEAVQFREYSMGQPHIFGWEFQGGSPATSTARNPTVTWTTPGNYRVRLFVENTSGRRDTLTREGFITVRAAQARAFLSEDFSAVQFPPTAWTVSSQDAETLFQPRWDREPDAGTFGFDDGAAMMDCHSNQNRYTRDWLITPPVTLPQADAGVRFAHAYSPLHIQQEEQEPWIFSDTLRVQVSPDAGATWHTLFAQGGEELMTTPLVNTLVTEPWQFVYKPEEETEWREQELSLVPWAGQLVRLRFEVQNGYGNRLYLDDVFVGTIPGVQRSSRTQGPDVRLYPNPVRNALHVALTEPQPSALHCTLLDAQGRSLSQHSLPAGTTQLHIPTGQLPAGLYILRYTQNGKTWAKRFLRQ